MKTINIGEKKDTKYGFRETCFGIVVENDKLMVVKKDGQLSLIGGGIDQNETHEQCIRREFLEESGYTISNKQEVVCIDCFWLAGNKWPLESLANIYVVEVDPSTKVKPLEENHTIEYIDLLKAEELLPLPYHKKAIHYYLNEYKK